MSEKKYYVKLIQTGLAHADERHQLYLWEFDGKYSYQGITYDKEYHPDRLNRYQFTKSELAEIMDGALYKGHEPNMDCVNLGCQEWINPLIELVPVEDGE